MRGNTKTILAAVFILQVVLIFAVNRLFVRDMREDVERTKQELIADSMSEKQANDIAYAMSNVKSNVASYVLNTALVLIGLNGILVTAVSNQFHRESLTE